MDAKDEKTFKKIIDTTLTELAGIVRDKELRELRVEDAELKIGIKYGEPSYGDLPARQAEQCRESDMHITSNMVGIFHRAHTPFDPPLVEKGHNVYEGQVVGYIESMGLMHEVRASLNGRIKDILIQENEPIQYGQSILLIALPE
jgi:biotin carboxyl carrier protein